MPNARTPRILLFAAVTALVSLAGAGPRAQAPGAKAGPPEAATALNWQMSR